MRRHGRILKRSPLVLAFAATASLPASADVIFVDDSAAPGGDGSSWTAAYKSLHDALIAANAATVPVEIWVAEGIYEPMVTNSPEKTFYLGRSHIHLYGGFVGNESSLGDRNGSRELTILNGGDTDDTGPDVAAFHVVTVQPQNGGPTRITDIMIDGFRVTGGRIDIDETSADITNTGGGGLIMVNVDSATVFDCRFEDNGLPEGSLANNGAAQNHLGGGAVLLYNCVPTAADVITIASVDFSWLDPAKCDGIPPNSVSEDPPSNSCHTVGGALAIRDTLGASTFANLGRVEVIDCTFCGNRSNAVSAPPTDLSTTATGGGAIAVSGTRGCHLDIVASPSDGKALFKHNRTIHGFSSSAGGAVWWVSPGGLTISGATFEDSVARHGGAVFYAVGTASHMHVHDCTFRWNHSHVLQSVSGEGGAIFVLHNQFGLMPPLIEDCMFDANGAIRDYEIDVLLPGSPVFQGGAIEITQGSVRRCRFVGNRAASRGGAINGAPEVIADCDFEGNRSLSYGGALHLGNNLSADTIIVRSRFAGNSAQAGGAIAMETDGTTIFNSRFYENVAMPWQKGFGGGGGPGDGGGVNPGPCETGTPDDVFGGAGSSLNPAVRGGAIALVGDNGEDLLVFGSVFRGNRCQSWHDDYLNCDPLVLQPCEMDIDESTYQSLDGAAVFFDHLTGLPEFAPRFENCTFVRNEILDMRNSTECKPRHPVIGTWSDCGGSVQCIDVVMRNCIVWDNRINGDNEVPSVPPSASDAAHCLIQHEADMAVYDPLTYSWASGLGECVFSEDPQFLGLYDLRLKGASSAIDTGSNLGLDMRDYLDEDMDGCTTDLPPFDADGVGFERFGMEMMTMCGIAGGPSDCGTTPTPEGRVVDIGAFEYRCYADLTGSSDPNDPTYGIPDGAVNAADFFYFLDQFVAGNLAAADLTGSSDPNDPNYGVPDGVVDAADFFYYLDLFVGCSVSG